MKLQRYARVLSGKASKDMWKDINRIKSKRIHYGVYSLACRCQELEGIVHKLEARVARLELDNP